MSDIIYMTIIGFAVIQMANYGGIGMLARLRCLIYFTRKYLKETFNR